MAPYLPNNNFFVSFDENSIFDLYFDQEDIQEDAIREYLFIYLYIISSFLFAICVCNFYT
tara:strand:- start:81 stop:260 length:180 start_codon:yes stop_codon:yes gene_type:complete